ncbi:MAG: protein kinase [Polyangiaceae bacterium]|nr:protein kinase [Polyangiaceae bacterium]
MAISDSVSERAKTRVGSTLCGKWSLDRVLGVGGMATVYAATHRNHARAAIKILHPEIALDAEVTPRFLREGYVANMVDHPGTVKVLDDDVDETGAPFLVMELLEGETLEARWARKGEKLPVSEVLALTIRVLDVLASAHDKGIVHRDLKPENLFLTTSGELKVLDFGIARLREMSSSASQTRTGSLLGTPAFMAPEQARGRWDDVDARTDIWAVGATVFTLLTGRFVFEAETVQEQLIMAATAKAPPIGSLVPEIPPELGEIIDRALSFDRFQRWPDARSMQSALRDTLATPDGEARLTLPLPSSPGLSESTTLIAPADVTSAITGRSYTTARPVTNAVESITGVRKRSRGIVVAAAALALFLIGGVVVWRVTGTEAKVVAAPPEPAPTVVVTVIKTAETAPPVASTPAPPTSASSKPAPAVKKQPPTVKVRPPTVKNPPPANPTPPAALTQKPPSTNPFDRRL